MATRLKTVLRSICLVIIYKTMPISYIVCRRTMGHGLAACLSGKVICIRSDLTNMEGNPFEDYSRSKVEKPASQHLWPYYKEPLSLGNGWYMQPHHCRDHRNHGLFDKAGYRRCLGRSRCNRIDPSSPGHHHCLSFPGNRKIRPTILYELCGRKHHPPPAQPTLQPHPGSAPVILSKRDDRRPHV